MDSKSEPSVCECLAHIYREPVKYGFKNDGSNITNFSVGTCVKKVVGFLVPGTEYRSGMKYVGCRPNDQYVGQEFTIKSITAELFVCWICKKKPLKNEIVTTIMLVGSDAKEVVLSDSKYEKNPHFHNWVKVGV